MAKKILYYLSIFILLLASLSHINAQDITINNSYKLSADEINGIIKMREEEKLARDVYLKLYEKWNLEIFKNVANSEQRHMDAVYKLILNYGLNDPIKNDELGVFQDENLRKLYTKLLAEGSSNITNALKVGATVEDLDIEDLEVLKKKTNKEDIIQAYENLERGSRNHLRSFVSQLNNYGVEYKPQYISKDMYENIINSEIERGGLPNSNEVGYGNKQGSISKGNQVNAAQPTGNKNNNIEYENKNSGFLDKISSFFKNLFGDIANIFNF